MKDNFDGSNLFASDGGSVGKAERMNRVLSFLVDSRMALPFSALYRNLCYQGADFSESSLKNYLKELRENGHVERIDADEFELGNVVISEESPGYWLATAEGRDHIEELREDHRDDIDTSHL